MFAYRLLPPLLGLVFVNASVLAQPSQPTTPSSTSRSEKWITQLPPDQWPTSTLKGLDIYSSNNGDKIGDIRDLILDSNGQVQAVVIGVGGYLGLGEREIAVPFNQIKLVNEPRSIASSTTTGEARLAGTSPGGGTVASPAAAGTAAVPAGSANPADSSAAAINAPIPAMPEASGTGPATRASGTAPNHAILLMSITKDELRTVPEFRGAR